MSTPDPHGRSAALERDALRLLTVLHQLGRPAEHAGFVAALDGEGHLLRLDHLVRHPLDLACAILDQLGSDEPAPNRRRSAQRGLRRLLGELERGARPRFRHRFDPGGWERRDDALSLLACRGLIAVRPAPERPGELRYLLTETAAQLLETQVFPHQPALAPILERCLLAREFLGHLAPETLAARLEQLPQRLDALRHDEQIPLEEDLLPRLFLEVFGEPL